MVYVPGLPGMYRGPMSLDDSRSLQRECFDPSPAVPMFERCGHRAPATFDRSPMMYREYPPSPALARHVECYWSLSVGGGPPAGTPRRVLPDGAIDFIFHRSAAAADVVGTMRQAVVVTLAEGTELVAVRFRPGGAYHFLEAPAGELTDRTVPLADALVGALHGDAERITEQIVTAPDIPCAVRRLDDALLQRLRPSDEATALAAAASALMTARGGRQPIAALADELGVGRRRLERAFHDRIGIPPKVFARVVRLQRFAAHLWSGTARDMHDAAFTAGYFDQAHLIHEFRELAGITPGGYVREIMGISG